MSVNTTPATWAAGENPTAAKMNAEIRDFATGVQAGWDTYSPVLSAGSTPASFSRQNGRYLRLGHLVICSVDLTASATATTGTWHLSLPVAQRNVLGVCLGTMWRVSPAGVRFASEVVTDGTASAAAFVDSGASAFLSGAIASGDSLQGILIYEAA